MKLLKADQVNQLQELPPLSRSSWDRAYKKSCGSKKIRCTDAYAGRAQAVLDWRNAVGCAATWFACLNMKGQVKACNILLCA